MIPRVWHHLPRQCVLFPTGSRRHISFAFCPVNVRFPSFPTVDSSSFRVFFRNSHQSHTRSGCSATRFREKVINAFDPIERNLRQESWMCFFFRKPDNRLIVGTGLSRPGSLSGLRNPGKVMFLFGDSLAKMLSLCRFCFVPGEKL